ncbi:MAG: Protocatechuate dioxygenase [Ilumatobacteraceae bacterium]|nr:Protocatechuate dioxygenase [Ilumatobacteraceae bacterium]
MAVPPLASADRAAPATDPDGALLPHAWRWRAVALTDGVEPGGMSNTRRTSTNLTLARSLDDRDVMTHDTDELEDHDRGLSFDLPRLVERRRLLQWAGGAGLVALGASQLLGIHGAAAAGLAVIPEETAGPYPGDGSNGPNILTSSGIVRSDIRSSFGTSTTVAQGIPTTVTLTVSDTTSGGTVQGLAVYLWHCNINGAYSLYGQGITNENYLRGVQETDANGQVTFTTIFPACYSGRWPHIHFEVYPSLAAATSASNKIATSQMAIPKSIADQVYATSGYSASVSNLTKVSLATDNVFSDGVSLETPTVTGDVSTTVGLSMAVAVNANGAGTVTTPVATIGDTTVTPTTSPATVGTASAFVTLASPKRLLDTRSAIGYSGAKPHAGSTTTLAVLGREGIPSSAVSAVVLNVTAVDATAAGYVTVWPDGATPTASNINLEVAGQTRANLVTVPVGSDGSVRLFSQSGAHLVADVFGWFAPASSSSGGRLQVLTPGRLLDTRVATMVGYSGSKPAAGTTVVVDVLGEQGVPSSGVSAVVLNVTATEATAAGYVTAWPSGSQPATSNLNVETAGQTIANQVVIPVGTDGSVRLYTQSGSHLIVDVTGWYTDSTATSGTAGLFIPVSPYRVLDTRSGGRPAAGSTTTLLLAATGTAAAGKTAVATNVTATQSAAAGYVTVYPSGTRPTASSLNVTAANQTISNHVVSSVGGDGGLRLYTQSGTHFVVDVNGWYA